MGFGSANNQIHVANNTSEDVYVFVTPNKDWAWGDLGFSIATSIATLGVGSVSVVNSVSTLSKLMNIVKLVIKVASYGAKVYKLADNITLELTQEKIEEARKIKQEIIDFLEKEAVKIPSKEFRQVDEVKNYNPLRMITPSGWGALFGASDVTLFITTSSLSHQVMFNTNSDFSWVVYQNEIVRAKYGTVWTPSREDGFYRFPLLDRLVVGDFLQPGESIGSPNGNYDFVYQTDGNAVIYKRNKPKGEDALWSSKTDGESAWRTYMQEDGNLVVYRAEQHPVWASNVYGEEEKYKNCTLVMQDDGNLVVYNGENEAIWASGTD